ncbi:MAG TPA: FRG domain-containing protein [Chryseosolibacter sp.]|nr:FRG domain-containing protein [Chryseosolibacter sp.]
MEPGYKTFSVSSFKEFQEILLDISTEQFTLYRGQSLDKTLLPKIARYELPDVEKTEREMLKDFQRRSLHLIDFQPGNSWDWLALAQHHGMATRLLDWTENPLIALWFSMATKLEPKHADYSVVWGFNVPNEDIVASTDELDPFQEGSTKVFKPNHITKRISAQFGWFTIHKYNNEKKFIAFEKNNQYSERLFKIKVNSDCFSECKRRLHTFGINSASMYPDIDGLAKHVEWLFLDK